MTPFFVVVLNGPPRVGKDTLANLVQTECHPWDQWGKMRIVGWHEKLSYPLKRSYCAFWDIPIEEFEIIKDKKNKFSDKGNIHREDIINLSENWMKPSLGYSILGKIAADEVRSTLGRGNYFPGCINLFVYSDCGFDEEFSRLCKELNGNVGIIRMVRQGCSFDGDSRKYLTVKEHIPHGLIENVGGTRELYAKFRKIVQPWLEERYLRGTDTEVPQEEKE